MCTICIYLINISIFCFVFFFFSSRRRHTRSLCDWSSDVCSSDLYNHGCYLGDALVRLCAQSMAPAQVVVVDRSEERRVGKECISRWALYYLKKKIKIKVSNST